jgi:hypothetical protein
MSLRRMSRNVFDAGLSVGRQAPEVDDGSDRHGGAYSAGAGPHPGAIREVVGDVAKDESRHVEVGSARARGRSRGSASRMLSCRVPEQMFGTKYGNGRVVYGGRRG